MGQNHSTQGLRLQEDKPTRNSTPSIQMPTQKTLQIITDEGILSVKLFESLTCGWLLSETIRLYEGEGVIVALKTKEGLDILDEWLLRFEKSLKPFSDQEQLIAHFREEVTGLNISNFQLLKNIGIGEHAKVVLSRKKDTGILYAMKILNKAEIVSNNKTYMLNSEKSILSHISHPFIIKLFWAFQSVRDI